jgi:hypothetical protein
VHGRAENVAVLEHHRAEVAADPDGHRLLVDFELRVQRDLLLHLGGGIQRIVGGREGRHDLIAHGLDDRAVVLIGGRPHHVDADAHHVARAQVAQQLIELGAADDVGEHDGDFDFFAHCRRQLYLTWRPLLGSRLRSQYPDSGWAAPNTAFPAPLPGAPRPRTGSDARLARPRGPPSAVHVPRDRVQPHARAAAQLGVGTTRSTISQGSGTATPDRSAPCSSSASSAGR